MKEFIKIENVYYKYYDNSDNFALKGIDLTINKGEFIAVVGHNGCGKSTLSKLLNSIFIPTTGTITVDGIDTKNDDKLFEIRKKVGLVLQNPDNQIVAGIVEEDVAFGCENLGFRPQEIRERVDYALKAVDMYDYRLHSPEKLSGGQKQRVAIAGIIAMKPECIVLDEPTAMLDPKGRDEVLNTIRELNKKLGITIVLITHYMEETILADKIVMMNDGAIMLSGTPKEFFSDVELLKRYRLDVPQVTELCYKLKGCGYELPDSVLDEHECVEALYKLLSNYNELL